MWGNELRCHSAERGPLDREQKEAADDSSMRGCIFSSNTLVSTEGLVSGLQDWTSMGKFPF